MNPRIAKLNLLNSKSINDVKLFSLTNTMDTGYVTDYYGHNDIKYAETWPYEHFNYVINDFGFRGDVLPREVDIAAFGCSFTFGTGLAQDMTWHNLLAKELNRTSFNFGLPAKSIQSIVDIFLIVSKHIKMSNAVFLFPSISRLQIAKTSPDSKKVYYLNTCVDFKSEVNRMIEVSEDAVYRAIPDEEMCKICKNQVYLLEHIAKERNINVYIGCWEYESYCFLKELELEYITLLPPWKSETIEFADSDKARDGTHPGPKHHFKWMNEIKGYIK